jgi:hypothetical protein
MLLLAFVTISTLLLRLLLIVVIIEMREPMRRRGKWATQANTFALIAAAMLAANSAIGLAAFNLRGPMPSLTEQAARFFMPLATTIALMLVAITAATAMRRREPIE